MASEIFDQNYQAYEEWFERHSDIYKAKIKAIRQILPSFEKGCEIGVGTGRFAEPLGIKLGVEPSSKMAEIAKRRGITTINATAKSLPFENGYCDLVLMVTTICFVDDIDKTLDEIYRVLKPGGWLVVGFVDKDSDLGKKYEKNKNSSRFYKAATFYSKKEVFSLFKKHGFILEECRETLFGNNLDNIDTTIYKGCKKGGAFLAMRWRKR